VQGGALLRLSTVLLRRVAGLGEGAVRMHASAQEEEAFLRSFTVSVVGREGQGGAVRVPITLVWPEDAPLLHETAEALALPAAGPAALRRSAALQLALPPHTSYTVLVQHLPSAAAAAAAQPPAAWAPLASPFPPKVWPSVFLQEDRATQGSWVGVYGSEGYSLTAFDAPSAVSNPFCALENENDSMLLECMDAGAVISTIPFASYGNAPTGKCPALSPGACAAPSANVTAVVAAACVGRSRCSIPVSNGAFGGDPCPGTPKVLAVAARCSSGGGQQPGGSAPPTDRARLPDYVAAARVVTYDGFCGARFNWVNGSADVRALQDPAGPATLPRHLGYMQPCGCPTSPLDIQLTDAALAAGKRYKLSLYFVCVFLGGRAGKGGLQ
jgi:hypothetical protein